MDSFCFLSRLKAAERKLSASWLQDRKGWLTRRRQEESTEAQRRPANGHQASFLFGSSPRPSQSTLPETKSIISPHLSGHSAWPVPRKTYRPESEIAALSMRPH
jgi:hypothetical protein